MTDRETADALARQMVEAGWDGWQAGMLVTNPAHSWDPMGDPSRLMAASYGEPGDTPMLLDPATAALIAVEVMHMEDAFSRRFEVAHLPPTIMSGGRRMWIAQEPGGQVFDSPHLGIAAARAWLALKETP